MSVYVLDQSIVRYYAYFTFDKTLQGFYHTEILAQQKLPRFNIDYKQATDMLKTGELIHHIKPVEKFVRVEITIRDNQKELIEYIINNLAADTTEIGIETDMELDLSHIKQIKHLEIFDSHGYLPNEYLYHLVKLLENRQTECITLRYNKNIPLEEDFEEFENIKVQINPFTIHSHIIVYEMQLKK